MATNMSATITNLRLDDQSLAFTVTISGDAGGKGSAMMLVYDASGTERERTRLGDMDAGQSWEATLDLPVSRLEDGDYGAWVYVSTESADGELGGAAEQGISFLVGRGRVYPSNEAVDKRSFTTPPTISGLRLDGSWVVFSMTNNEQFDVEATHQLSIGRENMNDQQIFHGEELVRAGATQQAHYLLPEGLPDGVHYATVMIQTEGSDYAVPELMYFQVNGNVITSVPTP